MHALVKPALAALSLLVAATPAADTGPPPTTLVIAHRGASGYLPEHTLSSKVMAFMMQADYIEQDVVLTRDDVPVVLHDITLDAVTDVATRFPGRAREDGRHYVIDFSLAELRSLHAHERVRPGDRGARFPGRFDPAAAIFRVHTLDDELTLLGGLDRAFGRHTGIHVELKDPAWHRAAGKDLAAAVLAVLAAHGYRDADDAVFLQSFDPEALRRIDDAGNTMAAVQLIGEDRWFGQAEGVHARMRTTAGLAEVASYADAIGVWLGHVYLGRQADGSPRLSPLVADARAAGLGVHLYTLRRDALPEGIADFDALMALAVDTLAVDGVFTDHPDLARHYLARKTSP